jgi:hypothetical protein
LTAAARDDEDHEGRGERMLTAELKNGIKTELKDGSALTATRN